MTADATRVRPIDGKWTIAETVDHISQTQIRGGEELRHLLAGQAPTASPVYEALRSGACQWAPWELLKEELHAANQAMIDLLQSAPEGTPSTDAPTVRTVMVTLRAHAGRRPPARRSISPSSPGKNTPCLQRLHLLDHRTQVKKLRAAISGSAAVQ